MHRMVFHVLGLPRITALSSSAAAAAVSADLLAVLRYGGQHGYYMPPMWEDSTTSPLLSAQNLIKVANKYYQGTGIQ